MKKFKRVFLTALFFVFELHANNIYIYDDLGSCEECVEETIKSIKEALSNKYKITRIDHKGVIAGIWSKEAALFVIPGGKAGPYAKLLNGDGNQIIKTYVARGGAFLGLCAGAYYAGSFVEFAKNTSIEVVGPRELALFKGCVVGPALAPYDYYSESGARAALIKLSESSCVLYYNGGGYFQDAATTANTKVLATYSTLEINQPAIIECKVEAGVAVLSGVHFEFPASFLTRIPKTDAYALDILEEQRKNLLREILIRLNLELKNN